MNFVGAEDAPGGAGKRMSGEEQGGVATSVAEFAVLATRVGGGRAGLEGGVGDFEFDAGDNDQSGGGAMYVDEETFGVWLDCTEFRYGRITLVDRVIGQ